MTEYLASPNATCRLRGQGSSPCVYLDDGDGGWRVVIRLNDEAPMPEPVRLEIELADGTRWHGDAEYGKINNTFGGIEHELVGRAPLLRVGASEA